MQLFRQEVEVGTLDVPEIQTTHFFSGQLPLRTSRAEEIEFGRALLPYVLSRGCRVHQCRIKKHGRVIHRMINVQRYKDLVVSHCKR